MPALACQVQEVAENSHGVYYRLYVTPPVHVIDRPQYDDYRRFMCLTCVSLRCRHTERVAQVLGIEVPEKGRGVVTLAAPLMEAAS